MAKNITAQSLLYDFLKEKVFDDYKLRLYRENYLRTLKERKKPEDLMQGDKSQVEEKLKDFLKKDYQDKIDFKLLIELVNQFKKQVKGEFSFRYYQYEAILFSYVFFILQKDKDFIKDYVKFLQTEENFGINENIDTHISKLSYWMATGSGKTYLMYFNLLLYLAFDNQENKNSLLASGKDIYILVPSDSLRTQHKNFIEQTFENENIGDFAFSFEGFKTDDEKEFETSLSFNGKNYKIILTSTQKFYSSEGIDKIENAVFVFDEGHKGVKKIGEKKKNKNDEDKKTKLLRQNNFIFDWSATFKQIYQAEIEFFKSKNFKEDTENKFFDYYAPTSIFRYDMSIFKSDGFGKLPKPVFVDGDKNEAVRINIIRSLIGFARQLKTWNEEIKVEENGVKGEKENVIFYKPLYLGVAHIIENWKDDNKNKKKQNKKKQNKKSKKQKTQEELQKEAQDNLKGTIKTIIDLYQEYHENKESFFENIKNELRNVNLSYEVVDYVKDLGILFQGKKEKINFELINKEEIIFNVGKYKALINIGDAKKFLEAIKNEKWNDVDTSEDKLNKNDGFFSRLEQKGGKDIVFLFGSKKFIEGWDNKRPSTLMIVKGAQESDTTAIQLLGRGLRLEGVNGDGFRHIMEEEKRDFELEKLYISGYKADELKKFLQQASGEIKVVKVQQTEFYNEQHKEEVEKLLDEGLLFYPKFEEKEVEKSEGEIYDVKYNDNAGVSEIIINEKIKIRLNMYIKYNILSIKENGEKKKSEENKLSKLDFDLIKPYILKTLNEFNFENKILIKIDEKNLEKIYQDIELIGNDDYDIFGKIRVIKRYFENLFRRILQKDKKFEVEEYEIKKEDIVPIDYNIEFRLNDKEELKKLLGVDLKLRQEYENEDYFLIDKNGLGKYFEIDDIKNINREIEELEKSLALINIEVAKKAVEKELNEKKEKLQYQKTLKLDKILNDLIKNLVKEKEKRHLYKRLFNVNEVKKELEKDSNNQKYGVLSKNKDSLNLHFTPIQTFELNDFEKESLENFIGKLENNFKGKYDIWFYRNSPKNGANLPYVSENGIISQFYPDFIFWLIPKNRNDKQVIIYFEPKGGSDENWKQKAQVLRYLNEKNENEALKVIYESSIQSGEIDYSEDKILEEVKNYFSGKKGDVIYLGVMDKQQT